MKYLAIFLLLISQNILGQNQDKTTPGSAILILENGKINQESYNGYSNIDNMLLIDKNTNFRMASVSKQFTAACIILLKNSKSIEYSDKLSKFFPDFKNGDKVTIWHLLTHTSGLYDYENLIPKDRIDQVLDVDVVRWVGETNTMNFEPGTQYKYSNTGFCILEQIIEKLSGKPYSQFIKEEIFIPLNMKNSYIYENGELMPHRAMGYAKNDAGEIVFSDQSITSATKGDGCVYTSINDYQKWMQAIRSNTLFNLKKEMSEVNFSIKTNLNYGLGWFNYENELYHTGSTCGFSNVIWISLDSKNAMVYFSNLAENHEGAFTLPIPSKIDFRKTILLTN